jgi:iron complex outermembrane receptor protein
VYLDEVPLSLTGYEQIDSRVMDLDRVEVLKGPQGTLYGQGSVAGTVRYISKDPVLDAFEGRVDASIGTIDGGGGQQTLTGIVNIPVVSDVFALRVAGTIENGGGWQDQPASGIYNGNNQDLRNIRAKALWKVSDALRAKTMVIVHRNESELGLGFENPDRTVFVAIDPSLRLIPKTYDYNLYNLDVAYDFAGSQLLSSTSYIKLDHDYPNSYVGGPETIFGGQLSGNGERSIDDEQFTQELRLMSTGEGPLKWTLGGFYRNTKHAYYELYDTVFAGIVYPDAVYSDDAHYNSRSFFADASYQATPRLTLGAGVRYFLDNQSYIDNSGIARKYDDFQSTDPRVYLSYKTSDDTSVYASVAKGFRSGGFNYGTMPGYDPESLINYEIGTKGLVAGGRFSYDLAAYYSSYSDMLRRGEVFTDGIFLQLTSNIGTTHIKGLEGGFSWRLGKGLTLNTTASWIDSKVASVHAADATNNPGDRMDYIPEIAFTVGTNYDFQWSTQTPGYFRLDYSYRDEVYYINRQNFPEAYLLQHSDAIGLLGARLGMQRGKANFEIFGTNLTDENKWIDPQHAWLQANRTRPRMVGLRVGYDFQ